MKKKPVRVPANAKTFNQICELPRDNVAWGDYRFSLDEGTVTITQQELGQLVKEKVILPRHVFERFARWYATGSTRSKR